MVNYEDFKGCFINQSFCEGGSGEVLEVKNKWSGEVLVALTTANQEQVDCALESSSRGHKALVKRSAGERATGLHQLADLVEKHKDTLTEIIIAEAGKPRRYAATEVDRSVSTLRIAAQEAVRFSGEVVNIDHGKGAGRTAFTKRVARGPIAAISPFNFPLNLALHKIAPALAVGCSVVLKPAGATPLTALYLAHLFAQCDLPQDGLNVVVCGNAMAERIVQSELISMVSFTGSDSVGWYLKGLAAKKPVALELGGNGAVIVESDADIEQVVEKLIPGAFLYAGQICISTQRVYVDENLYKPLLQALSAKIETLSIGNPSKEGVIVGPMIDKKAYEKTAERIQEAIDGGARIVAQSGGRSEDNNVFPATLITNTSPGMSIVQEEAFAPVCLVESVKGLDEAIAQVNNSRYGLQVGVFSQKLTSMQRCFDELEVGGVIMNDIPGFRVDSMPYGGVKDSGAGREGPKYAMEEMTESRLLEIGRAHV